MSRPYVSALIDTYNHGRFIEQAIASVLAQDLPASEMEILVVDDGSTDDTAARVKRFGDRVRYLYKPNGGQASAFNFSIPQSRGEIVAFLDGDDWWAKDKLRAVLEVFHKNPDVGAVGHGLFQVDSRGKPLGTVVPEKTYRLSVRTPEAARFFDQLKGFLGTSKVAMRRSVLERVLPVPEEVVIEADEFLWTMAVALADVVVLDQPLFYYRFHENNLFMVNSYDEARARRKYQALTGLLRHLPERLSTLGVSRETTDALLDSLRVEVDHHRLLLDGGTPWEMFRAEQAAFRLAYKKTTPGHRLFKALVLGLTLVMPPRRFCQLKRWYTTTGLRRLRRAMGEPTPAAPIVERRTES